MSDVVLFYGHNPVRKIILFYRQGADAPFWKTRTPHVSPDEIDTEALGAAQPRCERGMRVTVDGEPWGTVESVARLGASTRWRITLFEEGVAEALADLDKTLEASALAGDADEGAQAKNGAEAPLLDENEPPAKRKRKPKDDEGAQAKNGAEAPLLDENEPPAKRKRKPKDDEGAQTKNGAEAPLGDDDEPSAKRKRKRKPKDDEGEK